MADKEQRPKRIIHNRTSVGRKARVKDIMKKLPAGYIDAQRNNTKIKDCCRDTENLEYSTHKTDPDMKSANLAILECEVCGCKHYRAAGGRGETSS